MCNGNCNQGRTCDCAPSDRKPMSRGEALAFVLVMILSAAVSIAGVSAIAGYLWGWATR